MTASRERAQLDPREREYVATLEPAQREIVVTTLLRHRRLTRVVEGDAIPPLELHMLEDGRRVALAELLGGAPLVLVFGSFT